MLTPTSTSATSGSSRGPLTTSAMAATASPSHSLTSAATALPVASLTTVTGSAASSGLFELVAGATPSASTPEEAAAESNAAVLRRAEHSDPAEFAEFGRKLSTGNAADRSLDLEHVVSAVEGGPVSGGSVPSMSLEAAGASLDDSSAKGAAEAREDQLVLVCRQQMAEDRRSAEELEQLKQRRELCRSTWRLQSRTSRGGRRGLRRRRRPCATSTWYSNN